jgi:two-component system sensor histidine kinase VicK
VADYTQLASLKNVTLGILPSKEVLPPVVMDKEGIGLVLSNLLANAINYTPSHGAVTIATKLVADNYLEVSVKDTGIGIPKDEQARIFSRFFRASNAKSIHPDGSGIGLFITQNIIERHGGKISFVSLDHGTTFMFTLPFLEKDIPDQQKHFSEFFGNLGSA